MKVERLAIPEVILFTPPRYGDTRGFFSETFNARRFAEAGVKAPFVQDNHSRSTRGTLRGLHYQVEVVQGKLVRCSQGEVFDVAVDLRRGSPGYGRWVGVTLSDREQRQLWIPPGFAHGFYVLSETADLVYKCTAPYAPAHERIIRWDDPDLAIAWPLRGGAPLVSPKDAAGLAFRDAPACG